MEGRVFIIVQLKAALCGNFFFETRTKNLVKSSALKVFHRILFKSGHKT